MGIAGNATIVRIRHGVLLCLLATIVGASGCAGKVQGTASLPGQQQGLRQQPFIPSPRHTRAGEVKAAPALAHPATAGNEQSRPSAPLQAQAAYNSWLQQASESAHAHVHGWLKAYHAAQALAQARQNAAARLQARRAELQRQQAQIAALRDAQARRAVPPQPVPTRQPVSPPQPIPPTSPLDAPVPEAPAPGAVPTEAAVAATAEVVSPPLGVVRDVRPFRGRPYATLSIGYDAGIRRGMRLGLADPRTGAPAGVVVIDESGPAEAGGVVEGTDPLRLQPGLTVHAVADLRP